MGEGEGEGVGVGCRSIGKSTKNKTPLSMLTTTATTDETRGEEEGMVEGGVVKEVDKYVAAVGSMSLSVCLPARVLPFSER